MNTYSRRYDIDWIRVIAIGLLLIYHVAIGFQPWGIMIAFIANSKSWGSLWVPMTMLNVWRIPLLFFVSGMGVYFAMQNRTWKSLIVERSKRILFPLIFGAVAIVPIHVYIWQSYYNFDHAYAANPGHLWFLGNIFIYVLLLSPIFYLLIKNQDSRITSLIKRTLAHPLGLVLPLGAMVAEAMLIDPRPYEMYALTLHGFVLGMIAFFFGFCFVLSGSGFWNMILKFRWVFLLIAAVLFTIRLTQYAQFPPNYHLASESLFWILSVFSFGHKHLNRPSAALNYLSAAAYPVYIIHMIILYLASAIVFKIDIAVELQFFLVLLVTFGGCFITYEFLIRRYNFVRPFFGLNPKPRNKDGAAVDSTTPIASRT